MPQVPTRPVLAVLRVCQRMLMQTGFLFRSGISVVADCAYGYSHLRRESAGSCLGLSLYTRNMLGRVQWNAAFHAQLGRSQSFPALVGVRSPDSSI